MATETQGVFNQENGGVIRGGVFLPTRVTIYFFLKLSLKETQRTFIHLNGFIDVVEYLKGAVI